MMFKAERTHNKSPRQVWRVISSLAFFCLALVGLIGCNDSEFALGDPNGETIIDGTGVNPDVEVIGPIEGFGSIIVNGERYATDNTEFFYLGQHSSQDALQIGDFVRVLAGTDSLGNPVAVRVDHEPPVTGIVQQLDLESGTVLVSGHTVHIDLQTRFADDLGSLNGIALGSVIEVSGPADSAGDLIATRIETSSLIQSDTVLSGEITAVDATTQRLLVVSRTVDFSSLNIPLPAVGTHVVVEGETTDSGIINATRLTLRQADNSNILAVSLSGQAVNVMGDTSAQSFTLAGELIVLTPDTRFEGGTLADVQNSSRLIVFGIRADGHIIANRVTLLATAQ